MRSAWLTLLVLAGLATTVSAQNQTRPVSLGGRLTAEVAELAGLSYPRVGAHAVLPLLGPIDFYPAVEMDNVMSLHGVLAMRWEPLRNQASSSPWYLGAGLAVGSQPTKTIFLMGIQWPPTGPRPFLELRMVGDPRAAQLDVAAGFTLQLRPRS